MTERERLIKVLKGEKPDRVPWFADLSHWYWAENGRQWNLFVNHGTKQEIIDLHKEVKAGWYIGADSLHEEYYDDGVVREREMINDTAVESFKTSIGTISMLRVWNPVSFSWDIKKLMVENIYDLKVLLYATERRKFRPKYENWRNVEEIGNEVGLGFPNLAYTGLGSLISYYMGIENTIFAIYDEPELVRKYIDTFNEKHIELVDIYCKSPALHLLFTDNLTSNTQTPLLFRKYSFSHYKNIANRLHKAGKTVSAHLDGMLNNIIGIVAEAGIDVADACTPKPTGDLIPSEIRKQAGNNMILMGGVSPSMWLPQTNEKEFITHVKEWLDIRKVSSRLIQSAGDQVPPGTKLQRIKLVYDIVEEYGRYAL
jgi:hypothetical protein